VIFIFIPLVAFLFVLIGVGLTSIPVIIYRQHLIDSAAQKVNQSKAIFIGITGSFGKTSTKDFLFTLLSTRFKTAKSEANMNTAIGVALSVLNHLKNYHKIFIAELGAYKIGEIKEIAEFIKPKYGILTGIGNQHLDLFGSRKNLLIAKKELFLSLPKDGRAYINADFPEYKSFIKNIRCPVVSFSSTNPKADIFSKKLNFSRGKFSAEVVYHQQVFKITTNLIGFHNIVNLLPVIALASDIGIEKKTIIDTIAKIPPTTHRLSLHRGLNKAIILSDAYNSNVDGFIAAIQAGQFFDQPKKFIISRGIIELGKEKRILNQLRNNQIPLFTTDKLFKIEDKSNQVIYFNQEKKLIDFLKKIADQKTLIIVEGKFSFDSMKNLFKS
jgi:UDP-N-acetylmuramoyl-tripeptide--D-alanyl-D-alanine ligase